MISGCNGTQADKIAITDSSDVLHWINYVYRVQRIDKALGTRWTLSRPECQYLGDSVNGELS